MMEFKISFKDSTNEIEVNVSASVQRTTSEREAFSNYLKQLTNITEEYHSQFNRKLVPIYLNNPGPNKISVIKAIRNFIDIGLKEAKDLAVAPTPVLLSNVLSKNVALSFKKELEEAGASVLLGDNKFHIMG